MRACKVDRNQSEIVQALRKMGAAVLITSQLKSAFDLLVGYRGKLYIVEVKDGLLSPSKRKLTSGEIKCKELFESVGVPYNVVKSIDEAVELISE